MPRAGGAFKGQAPWTEGFALTARALLDTVRGDWRSGGMRFESRLAEAWSGAEQMRMFKTIRDEGSASPVAWARRGWAGRLLAAAIKTRRPSTLIVSMPRSGSSWVGDMMGRSADALYLREPVTQGDSAHYRKGTVFEPDEPDIADSYRRLADKAFLGWPDFPESIVRAPAQWALKERRERRLVIKEVNPRAVAWYLKRYRPRLIFLVRHPVAVALSHVKQGWMPDEPAAWADNGEWQGMNLRAAWNVVEDYPERAVVSYEDLCLDPLGHFRRLFDFAGLAWDDSSRDLIACYSADNDRRIEAWRDAVSTENARAQREQYRAYDLPWYREDAVW